MEEVVVLDVGRALEKVTTVMPHGSGTEKLRSECPSLVAKITLDEFERQRGIGNRIPEGYIALDGEYYAVGEAAKSYPSMQENRSAERLIAKDFYLPLSLYGFAEVSRRGTEDKPISPIVAFTYSTGDMQIVRKMRSFIMGDKPNQPPAETRRFKVETRQGATHVLFKRDRVHLHDEPQGTLSHLLYNRAGNLRQHTLPNQFLIVDIGGHTVHVVIVTSELKGKQRIYTPQLGQNALTLESGILWYVDRLWNNIKSHKTLGKHVAAIPRQPNHQTKRDMFRSGEMHIGSQTYDVSPVVSPLKTELVNEIWTNMGRYSPFDYATIIFTGGGAALLFEDLKKKFKQFDVRLPMDEDVAMQRVQFANADGIRNLLMARYNHGVFNDAGED